MIADPPEAKAAEVGRYRRALRALPGELAIITLIAFALIAFEWLFNATKPSFMSALPSWTKLSLLLVAPLPLVTAGVVLHLLITLLIVAAPARWKILHQTRRGVVAAAFLTPLIV